MFLNQSSFLVANKYPATNLWGNKSQSTRCAQMHFYRKISFSEKLKQDFKILDKWVVEVRLKTR
jgi:hypothetical protein